MLEAISGFGKSSSLLNRQNQLIGFRYLVFTSLLMNITNVVHHRCRFIITSLIAFRASLPYNPKLLMTFVLNCFSSFCCFLAYKLIGIILILGSNN